MKKLLLLFGVLVAIPCAVICQDLDVKKAIPIGLYDLVPHGTVPPIDTTGCKCKDGVTPDISATAVTGPIGVTKSGTKEKPIFNFTIPPGQNGKGIVSITSNPDTSWKVTYTDGTVWNSPPLQGPIGNCTGCPSGGGGAAKIPEYSPADFGGNGSDNNNDDAAFQLAINAAIANAGKFVVPKAANRWFLGNTVTIQSSSGQVWLDIEAYGNSGNIQWRGGSNKPVFKVIGLKGAIWRGLKVAIPNGVTGVQAFDFDTTPQSQSTSFVILENFYADLGDGANVHMRFGYNSSNQNGGGGADISIFNIMNCQTYGTRKKGQFAYQSIGRNTLAMNVYGGITAFCDGIFSNAAGTGIDPQQRGNGCWYFYGAHSSQNLCEFSLNFESTTVISGGRFEASDLFMRTGGGQNQVAVTVTAARINDFKGTGSLFELNTTTSLNIQNSQMHRQGGLFTDMILLGGGGGWGSVIIDQGGANANNLFRKTGSTTYKVYTRALGKFDQPNAVNVGQLYPDENGKQY